MVEFLLFSLIIKKVKFTRLHPVDSLLLLLLSVFSYFCLLQHILVGGQTCILEAKRPQNIYGEKYTYSASMQALARHPKNTRFSHSRQWESFLPSFYILYDAPQSFFSAPITNAYLLRKCWRCWCSRNHLVSPCSPHCVRMCVCMCAYVWACVRMRAHSRVCRSLRGCRLTSGAFDFEGNMAEVWFRSERREWGCEDVKPPPRAQIMTSINRDEVMEL